MSRLAFNPDANTGVVGFARPVIRRKENTAEGTSSSPLVRAADAIKNMEVTSSNAASRVKACSIATATKIKVALHKNRIARMLNINCSREGLFVKELLFNDGYAQDQITRGQVATL